MEKDLQIKITTSADTAAAKQAAGALNEVDQAAKRAGTTQKKTAEESTKAAQATGKAVNTLGEDFTKGAAAGRVLSEVMRGNVLAFGQLGAAIRALGALLKTNLIGTLFTLGAVAAAVLAPLIKGFIDTRKKIDETTDSAKALGQVKLDGLRRELDVLSGAASEAKMKFDLLQQSAAAIDDAQKALALAQIQSDPSLSAADKVTAAAGVEARFAARGTARERSAVAFEVEQAQRGVQGAEEAALGPRRDLVALTTSQQEMAGRNALFNELQGLTEVVGRGGATAEDTARFRSLTQQLQGRAPVTPEAAANIEGRLKEALEVANRAEANVSKALSAQRAAEFRLQTFEATQQVVQPLQTELRKSAVNGAVSAALRREQEAMSGLPGARDIALLRGDVAAAETSRSLLAAEQFGRAPDPAVQAALAEVDQRYSASIAALVQATKITGQVTVSGLDSLTAEQKAQAAAIKKRTAQLLNMRETQ